VVLAEHVEDGAGNGPFRCGNEIGVDKGVRAKLKSQALFFLAQHGCIDEVLGHGRPATATPRNRARDTDRSLPTGTASTCGTFVRDTDDAHASIDALCARSVPMAPRPMMPSVLPDSGPARAASIRFVPVGGAHTAASRRNRWRRGCCPAFARHAAGTGQIDAGVEIGTREPILDPGG
jgi:hypothetical protein